MRQRNALRGRVLVLAWLLLVPALPSPAQQDSTAEAPSIAELTSKLERALKAGNLEGALYRYRNLHKATGQEDAALLGRIGRLVLVRDLRAGHGWLAVTAAEVLALGGDAQAQELLLRFAGGKEQPVNLRLGALKALGEVGGESAAQVARQVADDDERRMMERLTALDALLAMREFSAVQSLSLVLRSAEHQVRIQALQILRDRNAPAKDLLRWAAGDEDPEIQLLALEGLMKLRDAEAQQTLSDLLGDGEVVVPSTFKQGEGAGQQGLGRFNRDLRMARALLPQRDPEAMEFIAVAALRPDVKYNQGVLAAELVLVSPVRGEEILTELLVIGSPTERLEAAAALAHRGRVSAAVPVLVEIYRAREGDDWQPKRLHAVIALAQIGNAEALALLREAAQQDSSDLVRHRAARELALAGDPLGLQVLRGLLETADRLLAQSTAIALVEVARQADPAWEQAAGGH